MTAQGKASTAARVWLGFLASFALLPVPLDAGGPLLISRDGKPRRWSTSEPIQLNLDRGSLGKLASPGDLMRNAIAAWNSVETSSLKLAIGEPLLKDVEDLSESEFNSLITRRDNTNPIIFDSDGDIFEGIYGAQNGIVGVAGPSLIQTNEGIIVKGFAMFNGAEVTQASADLIQAAMTHELGHFVNLEHSQVNGTRIDETVPGFNGTITTIDVETMFPLLVQADTQPHPMSSLHTDDIAAFSALYPTPEFQARAASISGNVFDVDGSTALQGVNVVARNVDDPFGDAVSSVSGLLYGSSPSSAAPSLKGAYELPGLTPNATYFVYMEEVAKFFRSGARVGPLDPPLDLIPTESVGFLEFWNGSEESSSNPPDDPLEASSLRLAAGATAARTDFIFNGVVPRVSSVTPSSESYQLPTQIAVKGANFIGATGVTFWKSPLDFQLADVKVLSANLLHARLPAGVIPGKYSVIVTNLQGSSAPGPAEFTVTEPLPVVTGVVPDAIENDRARTITIQGQHLLGAFAFRLQNSDSPDFPLKLVGNPESSSQALAEVPSGLLPGSYSIVTTNTAGDGKPSELQLFVLELAPVISTEISPPSARNSRSREVRVLGANLAGTTGVELLANGNAVPLVIRSTTLTEVLVTVPGGLEPATYTVRLTNTEGTATGPAVFTVKRASSGGGGCSRSGDGSTTSLPGVAWIAALLGLGAVIRRCFFRSQPPFFHGPQPRG